jgi:hypothetical protein
MQGNHKLKGIYSVLSRGRGVRSQYQQRLIMLMFSCYNNIGGKILS